MPWTNPPRSTTPTRSRGSTEEEFDSFTTNFKNRVTLTLHSKARLLVQIDGRVVSLSEQRLDLLAVQFAIGLYQHRETASRLRARKRASPNLQCVLLSAGTFLRGADKIANQSV